MVDDFDSRTISQLMMRGLSAPELCTRGFNICCIMGPFKKCLLAGFINVYGGMDDG